MQTSDYVNQYFNIAKVLLADFIYIPLTSHFSENTKKPASQTEVADEPSFKARVI